MSYDSLPMSASVQVGAVARRIGTILATHQHLLDLSCRGASAVDVRTLGGGGRGFGKVLSFAQNSEPVLTS
jgi:hypothetical protein